MSATIEMPTTKQRAEEMLEEISQPPHPHTVGMIDGKYSDPISRYGWPEQTQPPPEWLKGFIAAHELWEPRGELDNLVIEHRERVLSYIRTELETLQRTFTPQWMGQPAARWKEGVCAAIEEIHRLATSAGAGGDPDAGRGDIPARESGDDPVVLGPPTRRSRSSNVGGPPLVRPPNPEEESA